MRRIVWGTMVAAIALGAPAADAEDGCPPGYYYDRQTIACEQTHCPPGAGRTYTHECNCGEAWSQPFQTCWDNGLATHCIKAGEACKKDALGFDALTGNCQPGFRLESLTNETEAGTFRCVPQLPATVKCTVVDVDGNPIAGRVVKYAQETGDKASPYTDKQELTTGADGTVEFKVAAQGAPQLAFFTQDGTFRRSAAIEPGPLDPKACVLRTFDGPALEQQIKDGLADLLTSACIDKARIDKVRKIRFEFTGAGKALYDPNDDAILGLGVGETYDDAVRNVIHEMHHGAIAHGIDPKKDVGGAHENWEAVDVKKVKAGTPEQLAFEEGAADFLSMLYFHMRGDVYQANLTDPKEIEGALTRAGRGNGRKIEGVISAYLWALYRPVIESGPGGARQAYTDFLRTMTYEQRKATLGSWSTDPARTILDFNAARLKRSADASETGGGCGAMPIDPAKLRSLSEAYGITTERQTIIPGTGDNIPLASKVYDVPAGRPMTIDDFAADTSGRVTRFRAGGDQPAQVEIEADGRPTLRQGIATITDGPGRTPDLEVIPMGTELVITVAGGLQSVLVAHGGAEVLERGGQGRRIALAEGQVVDWTAKGGFGAVRDGRALIDGYLRAAAEADRGAAARKPMWKRHLPWIIPIGGALLLILVVVALRPKRRA